VFAQVLLYFAVVELYKLARRHYLRKKRLQHGEQGDAEEDIPRVGVPFHMANTMDVRQNFATQV
jgi:hypothetical protein